MKTTTVASAFLVAAAAAQPHIHGHQKHHRAAHQLDIVTTTSWVTEYETITKIIDSTQTLLVVSGHTSAVLPTTAAAEAATTTEPLSTSTSTSTSISTSTSTSSSTPVTTTTTTAAPQTTTTSSEAPPPPTTTSTTSIYTPPPPPPTTTSIYTPPPPPPPTTTSIYTPPPPPPASTPAPSPSSAAAPAPSPSSVSSGGSDWYSGEMTYYTLGLGACGTDNSGEDLTAMVIAAPAGFMGTQSNGNPMCNQAVTIEYNGVSVNAIVIDKCPGCSGYSIDVSEAVFNALTGNNLGLGRVDIEWKFNSYIP